MSTRCVTRRVALVACVDDDPVQRASAAKRAFVTTKVMMQDENGGDGNKARAATVKEDVIWVGHEMGV